MLCSCAKGLKEKKRIQGFPQRREGAKKKTSRQVIKKQICKEPSGF